MFLNDFNGEGPEKREQYLKYKRYAVENEYEMMAHLLNKLNICDKE